MGIGRRYPLYRGASGRVLFGAYDRRSQQRILSSLPLNERRKVKQLLATTRREGYSINEGEITESVGALSVPVFDQHQKVIGGVVCSRSIFRWNNQQP